MKPHYYLMKCKKILRLESGHLFSSLPDIVQQNLLTNAPLESMNQDQANWRVVIFRDEIMEFEEYLEWMGSSEAFEYQEDEFAH
jgi:hypothetical protein